MFETNASKILCYGELYNFVFKWYKLLQFPTKPFVPKARYSVEQIISPTHLSWKLAIMTGQVVGLKMKITAAVT